MKIDKITLSIFEQSGNTGRFNLVEEGTNAQRRWRRQHHSKLQSEIHVLHVHTDSGIEGVCTVGDARYTTMRISDLEQLRVLAIGEDAFDRERLYSKMRAATRGMFAKPGWFGAFDNCLWDIAGKAAGLPVSALLGRARHACQAYYNYGGKTLPLAVASAQKALEMGFTALKDHFTGSAAENIKWATAVRENVGPGVDLLHDAVLADYSFDDALRAGTALNELKFGWMEEPLPDADMHRLKQLVSKVDIPVLTLETLMHDVVISAQWLMAGATDLIRGNARHSTTSVIKLAHLAQSFGTRIELNGPGGLFGLVHTHLVCAIDNTSYYEYFPGGTRDEIGKEIGLINPPIPHNGMIAPPDGPGWGAEWDWNYFRKVRVAER
jgi:L-alanine-DL-glutamate epimerase-like enolase superfamily enzyme